MNALSLTKSFKNELDPNGFNWKNVSNELKRIYFGEFKKAFYWDSSIDSAVQIQWERWAAKRYSDFVSKLKANMVQSDTIPNNVWESWLRLWKDPKCVEKLEINTKNRCGGSKISTGTHTGSSISVGEHRKRLGMLQQQTQTQSDIDQCKAYYQAARGEKKRRVYGLGSQAKCYYGPNLHDSLGSDATSSTTPPNSQSTPTRNVDELVMRLISALTDHIVHVIVERVRELVSLPSHQPNTDMAPTVPTSSIAANIDEVHALGSDDDRNSPA